MGKDIGISLGTATTVVYLKGRGVVLDERTAAAYDRETKKMAGGQSADIGEDAMITAERIPGAVEIINPLKSTPVLNSDETERFIKRSIGGHTSAFMKPRVALCVSSSLADYEKTGLLSVLERNGAGKAYLVNKAVASAIGAGMDVSAPVEGGLVIHIGGFETEVAAFAGGKTVITESISMAGDDFNDAIINYIIDRRHIIIDTKTAENIKFEIGAVWKHDDKDAKNEMWVVGVKTEDGLPKKIKIRVGELIAAFEEPLSLLLDAICDIIDRIPDDSYYFIEQHGIILTGGGSKLYGLDKMIAQITGLETRVADKPEQCAAVGACGALAYGASISEGGILISRYDLSEVG